MQFKEHEIVATASVGVALAPADGNSPERLLKSADLALYKGKADGRNCIRFFLPEMDAELQARIELERTIRDAVLHDRFELHYQPVFEMSGPPPHRLRGAGPPARGRRNTDPAVGLHSRCRGHAAHRQDRRMGVAGGVPHRRDLAGAPDGRGEPVAGAIRGRQRQRTSSPPRSKEAGLAPHRLELEITETLLLGDSEAIMAELQTLKAMGVAIVMDDFGTGYSSLSYLWRFPFDKIKIDRSFMQGFDGSGRDAETVVKTIIALGRELNMRVTVEGVETAKQAAFLDKADGDQAQGFFFGRPVPASEVAASILADFQPPKALTLAAEAKFRLVK